MRTSPIWKLFSREGDKAKCLFCNKRLVVRQRSTGNLIQHVKTLHPDEYNKVLLSTRKMDGEGQVSYSQKYDDSDVIPIMDLGERKYRLGVAYSDVGSKHSSAEDYSDFESEASEEENEISRLDKVVSLLDRSSAHVLFMNRVFNSFPAGMQQPSQSQLIFCFDVISAIFHNKLKTSNLEGSIIKSDFELFKEIVSNSVPNILLMRKLKNLTWKAIINIVRRSYQTLQGSEDDDVYDEKIDKLRTFAERKKINFEKLSNMLKKIHDRVMQFRL